jgi:ecotin
MPTPRSHTFVLLAAVALAWVSGCREPKPTFDPDLDRVLKPFPQAGPGEVRHVFEVPVEADESLLQVELIGGQIREIDCNQHWLAGEFETVGLDGWGYDFYRFVSDGAMTSTKMGCGNQPLEAKLVTATPLTLPYNSRMPIVVYAPEGYAIHYRIYRGGPLRP